MGVQRRTRALHPTGVAHIEVAVTRIGRLNRIAAAVLRPLMTLVFACRQRVVRIIHARPRLASRSASAVALVLAKTVQVAVAQTQAPPVRSVPSVDLDR